MEYATAIESAELKTGDYEVAVGIHEGKCKIIAIFDNEENAKACIAEIIHALNGDEKVGYSFSWLNKEVF